MAARESDSEVAARLIERLLADPAFRAAFRRDPAAACREAGLDALADEMALGAGKAMMTLDVRESKSSLAGVMMAAAMEGIGLYEFSAHLLPHLEDIPAEVGDVLSRVHLPAVGGALAGGPPAADQADLAASAPGGGGAAEAAANGVGGGGGGGAAAAEAPTAPTAGPQPKAAAPEAKAPAASEAPAKPAAPPEAESPPPARASSDLDSLGDNLPDGSDLPEPDAGALADKLAGNPNLTLDASTKAAFASGETDPRMAELLLKLAERHHITLTGTPSGIDISAVDGELVGPDSAAGRELASELSALDPSIRPTEVGSPWPIAAPGYSSAASDQTHIHIGFGDAKPAADASPSGGSASDDVPPAHVAASDAGAPATPMRGDTLAFGAVSPRAAAAAGDGPPEAGGSLAFLKAVEPRRPAATPAAGALADAAAPTAFAGGPDAYPGDDAPRAQIAAWLGEQARKRGLPPELPVMASLVESGMHNLSGGDRDSVGFFQMRVGFWNSGPYAGFPDDPKKQVDWFLDQAEAVKRQRVARGQSIDDPHQYGEWIADVERPAEQYRGRYQLRLEEAQGLLRQAPGGGGAPVDAAAPAGGGVPVDAATPGGHAPIDPAQFGAEGTGGAPDAEAVALLHNKNVILDATGMADVKAGRIDPRVVAVITKLSHDHRITISCMCSDHSKFTAGGSVSNHHFGRGADIAAVDGVPVNSSNFDAREIAMELQSFDPSIRPNEIGSPWAIAGPGYFTDAAHQNHLHIGFKQAIDPGWKPPADVAASGAPGTAAASGAAAAAPGAAAPVAGAPVAAAKPADSLAFAAVTRDSAARALAASKGAKAPSGSLSFMQAVQQPPQQPAAASAGGGAPPEAAGAGAAADAAASAAGGGGAGPKALAALAEAKKYLGTPYHWGGSTPQTGFDCSGLMQWAYAHAGIQIPRTSETQILAGNGTPVDRDHLRPGDLIFFRDPSGDVHHVAMSLGGDKFIQAPHTGDVVKISSLDEPYYAQQFTGGRRFDQGAPVAPAPAVAPAVAPPAPAVDPLEVAKAQAAVARDAAEVRRHDSLLFKAVSAQEARKARATVQFMQAIDPETARKAAAAAPPEAVTPAQAPAGAPPEATDPGPAPDLSGVDLGDYPGNDAPKAELAKWMAKQAEKAGLPPELPVMASLVESGVRNLPGGDADSVGFFQMRVGIWNKGAYAGFPDDPRLQVKWFIDNALTVKRRRVAAGQSIDDPRQFGEWIADVERPAAQFRYRYQLRLAEARDLLRS